MKLIAHLVAGALAALLLVTPAVAQPTERLLLCGDQLLAAVPKTNLPAGLPSTRCSEIKGFGEAMTVPAGTGATILEGVSVLKGPDANSLTLRQAILTRSFLGRVYVHLLIEDPAAGTLEVFRTRIDDTRAVSLSAESSEAGMVEETRLEGSAYDWSVWSPPAPPSTGPTDHFCWDQSTGRTC